MDIFAFKIHKFSGTLAQSIFLSSLSHLLPLLILHYALFVITHATSIVLHAQKILRDERRHKR